MGKTATASETVLVGHVSLLPNTTVQYAPT